jgi:capsular polysaccharide biosynthesis protein
MVEENGTLFTTTDLNALADGASCIEDGAVGVKRRVLLPPVQVDIAPFMFGEADLSALAIHEVPAAGAWRQSHYKTGEVPYFVLRNAVIHSTAGIITIGHHLAADTLAHVHFPDHGLSKDADPNRIRLASEQPRHLAGRFVHLLAGGGTMNYYHWMIDIVGRLSVQPELKETDILLLPRLEQRFQVQTLELLAQGRPLRLCLLGQRQTLVVDELVFVPSLSGWGWTYRPEILGIFDRIKTSLGPMRPPHRRLYISRRGTERRPLTNEADVIALMEEQGFEILTLEDIDVAQQVRVFAEASHIVAPHGAGLANLIFCPVGSAVCELHMDHYVNWCFQRLANIRQLRYGCVIGSAIGLRNDQWPHATSWTINIGTLRRALEAGGFGAVSPNRN